MTFWLALFLASWTLPPMWLAYATSAMVLAVGWRQEFGRETAARTRRRRCEETS